MFRALQLCANKLESSDVTEEIDNKNLPSP
jgi:hypothetical protein